MNANQYITFIKQNKDSVFCPICKQWHKKDIFYQETGYYENQYACCTENATQANANAELVNMVSQVKMI